MKHKVEEYFALTRTLKAERLPRAIKALRGRAFNWKLRWKLSNPQATLFEFVSQCSSDSSFSITPIYQSMYWMKTQNWSNLMVLGKIDNHVACFLKGLI